LDRIESLFLIQWICLKLNYLEFSPTPHKGYQGIFSTGAAGCTGVALGDGCAAEATTSTPLSQINFFADLMQVYFLPLMIEVDPNFGHVDPGLTAPKVGKARLALMMDTESSSAKVFLTTKILLRLA
jgi:hypothetical protein